jgi:peptide/nickel transport system substrate-binding protein
MEALRDDWFNAADLAEQKKVGLKMQLRAFENVPYWPLGSGEQATAFQKDITGVPEGFVIFWSVRRA